VQYDEHLNKSMGQWHVKKAFGRKVLNIRGCVLVIKIHLLTTPTKTYYLSTCHKFHPLVV
jgi:hypothetical protein